MAHMKLFEVTLKYFFCADTKDSAEKEMLRSFGGNYASTELKEIKAGFSFVHPTDEEDIDIQF